MHENQKILVIVAVCLRRVFYRGMADICANGDGNPAKKVHLSKKIGTHNGTFHCDEALACFMLKQLAEYSNAEIIRTRDESLLDTCDIVVDVGKIYDPVKHRYDHHQRSFNESMSTLKPGKKWITKLSSAGLVYVHFGERLVAQLLQKPVDDPVTGVIYDRVYELFIEEIDANDNGINQYDGKPRFAITTTLGSRVGALNPAWNEQTSEEDMMVRFEKAMALAGSELLDKIKYYSNSWLPARAVVEDALSKRMEVDPSGEIICLKQGGCPWKDHLLSLEEEQGIEPGIKYVLYPDMSGNWRVQCVPVMLGSFENRLSLHEPWRGVRDQDLSEVSGIQGAIFVHANGFIGGCQTYEGVLEMARCTLKENKAAN